MNKSSATNRPIYQVWAGIKKRCLNQNDKFYHRYGGRGIKICDEWMSYENFHYWAIKHYKDGLQIDRIDNNGNYTPENCRFVTPAENVQNSSKAKINMEIANKIRDDYKKGFSVDSIISMYGISKQAIYRIIQNESWHDQEYNPPPKRQQSSMTDEDKENARQLFKDGTSLKALCEMFGKSKGSMHYILHGRK